jgi:uncharacterized protein (DUF58 family)
MHDWFARRVLGPLGLTWWRHPLPLDRTLRVLPDPATRAFERARARAGASATIAAFGAVPTTSTAAVSRGRPARRIDWKASAAQDDLITRVIVVEQRQEVMLMIRRRAGQPHRDRWPARLGHFVESRCPFVSLAASTDDAIGLIAYADQPLVGCAAAAGRDLRIASAARARTTGTAADRVEPAARGAAIAGHRATSDAGRDDDGHR